MFRFSFFCRSTFVSYLFLSSVLFSRFTFPFASTKIIAYLSLVVKCAIYTGMLLTLLPNAYFVEFVIAFNRLLLHCERHGTF